MFKYQWYIDLINVLLRKELSLRYKNSILGYLWSIMSPLASAAIFFVVFKVYMRFDVENYLILLLSGLFPWQWFNNSVSQSPQVFLINSSLIKKMAFPRYILPLVSNLHDMVHFLLALPVLLGFMIFYGLYPGSTWLYGVPVMLFVTLITIFGLSLILASTNLFFRDIGNLVVVILNIVFYSTPIIYVLDLVPKEYHLFFKINPFAPMFICWRSLFCENLISYEYLLLSCFYGLSFAVLGILVYRRLAPKFAEVL